MLKILFEKLGAVTVLYFSDTSPAFTSAELGSIRAISEKF